MKQARRNPRRLMTATAALLLVCVPASMLIAQAASYRTWSAQKEAGGEKFDFESNLVEEGITVDGVRDEAYGDTPVLIYGNSNHVSLYTRHTDNAIYFYFEVADDCLRTLASSDTEAWRDDCVELYIDPMLDGGATPQGDDIQLNVSLSGYMRQLRGSGTAWTAGTVNVSRAITHEGTLNDTSDTDVGWAVEMRLSYFQLGAGLNASSDIGITFAHGDLTATGTERGWHGLSGRTDGLRVPSTGVPDGYLVLTHDDRLMNKTDYANSLVPEATVQGTVLAADGTPVAGASVTGSDGKTTVTDAGGVFRLYDIRPDYNYIVSVGAEGYRTAELEFTRAALLAAQGTEVNADVTLWRADAAVKRVTGELISLAGSVGGATVTLAGYPGVSALSAEDGTFAIDVWEGGDYTLIIEKAGFERAYVTSAVRTLGECELYATYAEMGYSKAADLAYNYADGYVARGLEGIVARFELPYTLGGEERLELYFNTGETGLHGIYAPGDHRLIVGSDGARLEAWDGSAWAPSEATFEAEASYAGNGSQLDVFVPYASIGCGQTDVVGVAYAFWNGSAYDGIGCSLRGDGTLDASSTADYLRLSAQGEVFISYTNSGDGTFFYYNAATTTLAAAVNGGVADNADKIYATYERSASGLTLTFMVEDTLGTHANTATGIAGAEAVNIVLDLDGWRGTGWNLYTGSTNCYDLNLRIYADGVRYVNSSAFSAQASNQLYWSDLSHNNGVASNFILDASDLPENICTVTPGRGYDTYTFTFTWEQLSQLCGGTVSAATTVRMGFWEVSETSVTTILMYSSNSTQNWAYTNGVQSGSITDVASQSRYYVL